MFPKELLLAVICSASLSLWIFNKKEIAIVIAISFSFFTFFLGFISYPSLLLIVLFSLSCYYYKNTKNVFFRFPLSALILLFSLLPFTTLLQSSQQVPIFSGERFSPISAPFWMGINIEKGVCGIILAAFLLNISRSFSNWKKIFKEFIPVYIILTVVLLLPAYLTNFIKYDFKLPENMYLFIANNLLLTCVAEEVIFRGFLQKNLNNIFVKNFKMSKAAPLLSLLLTAILFGLFHYKSGILMIVFAFLAGIGYGYAFQKSEKIESAILVHFGVNITHFIFFTYPFYKV
ncbi:CPBP family intramembrane metalloprotease [Pigmentibacter sp. JX0631]|uniref:CPBP family intramembrane glutamic endopeptidase n=1 Tax=Pigmentibacter sp. JX0631 TaxID=2976982 RepID=UPI002468A6C9|nr:CPBP family intramembrane metalloprotease [Pigmentibacter sp. JX0631]WGL60016.1 CPBP family intramembrane metalloprotease [Pigmentibacter sp. JX0631]